MPHTPSTPSKCMTEDQSGMSLGGVPIPQFSELDFSTQLQILRTHLLLIMAV